MPKSPSGRIVIQIDPELKKRLYAILALKGKTLKDWFIDAAMDEINNPRFEKADGDKLSNYKKYIKGGER